ncbi:PstS family phosphate ABC transporter substrate-binding protein [Brevibacillus humidisoli]|uniref:PstS family phosphate ABC transporter substrate-binding protein n=1 Tax=Brevibacillus humidisoli TaxID=2895522 RepID=UPI001E4C3884|nr:PstS family phosphate ABC transporter substrate-binding protein [Brevibacillus humidisoli]UFJ40930.1 PstS family phosphate ABC transporter substrate-binding protein [Brevibacillus humidisoli]
MKKFGGLMMALALAGGVLAGCGQTAEQNPAPSNNQGNGSAQAPAETDKEQGAELSGEVLIAGSSTVYPITIVAAEKFMDENPGVNVSVASTGTGGGFKKWVVGETDINNASSRIKDSVIEEAKANGIEHLELTVAYDALTVVVNKENDFVDQLTIEELKKIWEPNSQVKLWSEVREGWPAEEIKLYGPGTDSGTFEYFTETVVGEAKSSRTDYTPSEDDNVLVQGVAGDQYSLGYFGFAYFAENSDKLKAVPIVNPESGKAVMPSDQTIEDGSYAPLGRELWIYPSKQALKKPEVAAFVKFYMDNVAEFAKEGGYTPLPEAKYDEERKELEEALK